MAESGEVKKNEINPSLTERKKLSHKQLKTLRKKQKRKVLRQQSAIQRDEIQQKEEQEKENSPSNLDRLQGEQQAKLLEEREEWERKRQHELWLEREKRAQAEWRAKLAWEEKEKKRKQEEERLIKEEWEERQRLEKEEEEKKEKESLEKKRRQDELLKEATKDSKTGGEPWHNPLAPQVIGIERERENCPFFVKVGACRFGNRCSRNHAVPDSSSIIMIPGMYANFEMEQSLHDEFDTDISLEYEDGERYQQYREFYEDVLPEFKSVGRIVQFKVSCNCEIHLRGNVYVQYKREEDAQAAFMKFNARWYAGKQLNCEFRDISRWKNAICGMFRQKRCPKGKTCNFLHVFRNPGNEFWEADRDFDRNISSHTREGYSQRSHYYHRYSQHERKYDHRSHRSRGRDRSRSRSRSPSHSRRVSRRRSRSRSRSRSYSPKRRRKSRSKSYSPKRKKSRSPSYSPSRRRKSHSRSRSYSPKRQRKSDSRSKSRSYSPKGRKRSRSPSISSNKKSRKKRHKSKPLLPSSERHCTESSLKYSRSPSIERRRKNHKHHKKKSKKKRKESRSETPAVPLVDSVTEWLENIPGSGKSASDPENNTDGAGTEPSDQEKNESAGTTKSGSPEKINNHDDLPETTSGRQSEAENDNRDLTNDIHLNGQVS